MSGKSVFRAVCAAGATLLVAGSIAPGAAAVVSAEDSGDVQVTVRKTVRQAGTATGEITESSMYTQVSAVGTGTRTVTVPVGTESNRNLNSFGAFPMEGDAVVFDLDVDGSVEERTLTEAESFPMKIAVRVTLDGQEISPEDVVGQSGVLDVEYTVTNTTQKTEQVTFTDAEGNEVTEDFPTAVPFAGSLDLVLPQGFNEVTAPGATVAGNGENGTQLGYTMVLFPPLGSVEAKVGYQARVTNASFPQASFSFLPLIPFENSTVSGTVEAYKSGAETGSTIFGAGTQIGENLLKLQDGAGQLLAGLGQLKAGAEQLSDGLVNTAAPGSAALADGANQVSDGLSQLNGNVPALEDGVNQLDDGANQLSDGLNQLDAQVPALESGVGQLDSGAQQLSAGLNQLNGQVPALETGVAKLATGAGDLEAGMQQLSGGLAQLADVNSGMPALEEGAKQLQFGISHPKGTLGPTDPGGLLEGLQDLVAGLTQVSAGADQVAAGLPNAKGGVDQVNAGLDAALAPGGDIDLLQGGVTQLKGYCQSIADPTEEPTCVGIGDAVLQGVDDLRSATDNASVGLDQVSAGLDTAIAGAQQVAGGLSQKILPGAQQLEGGVATQLKPGMEKLVAGITAATAAVVQKLNPGSQQLTAGATQLSDGLDQLNGQIPGLASGVSQLAVGGQQLADGTSQLNAQVPTLAAGVEQLAAGGEALADGTGELASNVPTLADGVEQLDDGAAQVADGADQLADGLGAAADGSGQLADGLGEAEPGAGQLEDGAGRLKKEGSDELVKAGKDAQIGFARSVAQLESAQQTGLEGQGIPFGPAEGTDVVTSAAYVVYLDGIAADTENNAVKFGLGAALIAGAAGAAYAGMRRRAVA